MNQRDSRQGKGPFIVDSEITIYKNAVVDERPKVMCDRQSSSSEELMDTSKETAMEKSNETDTEVQLDNLGITEINREKQINDFIAESRRQSFDDEPGTSGWKPPARDLSQHRQQLKMAEQVAHDKIRAAEEKKAKVYQPTGEIQEVQSMDIELNNNFVHSAMVDENYLVVAAHIDETMQKKIEQGQYVDFARLIPHDRVLEEDDKMQMIVKQGKTFWKLTASLECPTINGLNKWEQAFRVYSDIYTRAHPHRATELIQYNHIIHMTALVYMWDNVYLYDKDFCIHMSRFPTRK